MTVLYYLAIFIFMILSPILCLVILVQESKSMGLGASFGGEAGESLFGTSTAAVLKKITAYLAIIFISFCIILSVWTKSMGKPKSFQPAAIEQEVASQ
ncbi:MAG: preprotein translocase subunit SecG [Chlamydiae bacterium]|nr:preprotein translocase subunit SecG [Chlamydiota bacterium]